MRILSIVDDVLNRVTMYRLVLWYTAALLALAFLGGFIGMAPVDPAQLAMSGVIVMVACRMLNAGFAWAYRVPVNTESATITALILILILRPVAPTDWMGLAGLLLASAVAIGSKFLLAVRRKHIFNPVAAGAVASAYVLAQPATWWIDGNLFLVGAVVLGGLMVVRKVRRFDMVGVYILANLAVTLLTAPPGMMLDTLHFTLVSSPLFFAGAAMLTEPLTAPPGKGTRMIFGAIVGALSSPGSHIGSYYFLPEVAFLVGNAFAFLVNPHGRFRLVLERIERSAEGCYDFVFRSERPLPFRPGQYVDWTLDVPNPDNRGNRRPFTIASAPGEREVRMGVKFYPQPSAYKRALAKLRPGDTIYATGIAGTFTLPEGPEAKMVFIAGGIGVTPFRSMVQHMIEQGDRRPAVLLYGTRTATEISYSDIFEAAREQIGLRTVYAIAEPEEGLRGHHTGFIDVELIRREVPDWAERTYFVSGPQGMVRHFRKVLAELGISPTRIRVDDFPGFA